MGVFENLQKGDTTKMPLTDIACKGAKAKDRPYKLADTKGLYLHVMENGAKYWRYKYRYLNKQKVLALGVYPEASLSEAREKHRMAHKLVSEGLDPSAHKQDLKRQRFLNAENTFQAVAKDWFDHNKDVWSENHRRTVWRRLENDVFPTIGHLPIKEINAPILLECIRSIEKRQAFEVARRSLQYCGGVFRFGIVTGRAERDPSQDLKGALKPYKKGHYAAMEAKDLPEFLAKVERNEGRLFTTTKLALEILMLTFVRTNELIKAKWEEFDLDEGTWIIPAARMKMRKDHLVPLSKQVIERLEELKKLNGNRPYIFPSQRNPRSHMSNNAILVALDRMGYRGQHTGHGFRALAMSTIKENLGYRHEVIDRQLAHAHKNQVDAAYDRAQFLPDRKRMMQEWADYLDDLRTGKNIVKANFRKGA